ncbi:MULTISPECIES: TonB-dependent receptor domain-containing protein [Flavobacteriaceae]|uniref:TonB-dependent receptor n=2 Tax=Flavobacteriaceae TaxID=49546 RepID=A0A4Y8ANS3_9FLAO|nr:MULTISPECIES: TonB-dependent receptor [Flavobacteriaceae]TEW72107.1 TonB-dependent receptor [Gramella jeungdoensis]GGK56453.1 ligand-gated channel [Lutibacter litoralis]
MKNKIVLTLSILLISMISFAQSTKLSGKIIDDKTGAPIEYATLRVLKTNIATLTNGAGEFTLNAEVDDEVEVTHVSYKTIKIFLKNQNIIRLELAQIELNEILVAANPLQDISQSVVINDTEKRISQPRSVGHLFKEIKGFGITKKGAYASEPVFRAFKYEQLNIQYDGGMKVLNACPNRMDPITTHVIPEEIEKIEIVKGPFTVRFGQNFGGIINLVSKNPTKGKHGFHGSIEGGYESNGNNLVMGASALYVEDKFDVHLNGSYRDFGDYKDGNGTKVPASFKTTDYSLRIGINPTEKQRFQLSWRQSFGRDIDHAGLPMDSPFDDSFLAGIDYKINAISQKIASFSVKIFHSYVDHLMTNKDRPSFKMTGASSPVESWTTGGKIELVLLPTENARIYTGIDANLIDRAGDRTRIVKIINGTMLPTPKTFVDKIWQDASLNDIGVFAEGNFKIVDNTSFTAGIRADFIATSLNDPAPDFEALYGGSIEDETEVNVSANTSIKYQKNGFQTQLAVGRGIRTASMIERYINHFAVGVDPYEYVGNPNLKPEINNQIELSIVKKFETIEIGASVFHSFLEDYISAIVKTSIPRKFMPTNPPVFAKQFINLDKASQTGVEFSFNVKASDNLTFTSDVSYTQAENKDFDEPLAHIPPFMANLRVKYEVDNYWFTLNSRLVARQDRISSTFMEEETPGFGTLDFRAGYTPFKGVSIGVAVLNMFDKNYYEHLNFSYKNSNTLSGRIYEPGRNFTTYLKYQF